MIASRGMGAIRASKMPGAKTKKRRDSTDFTEFAKGGKVGLYANIHAKRRRIAKGSGEKMRRVGQKGAPTAEAFVQSAKTVRK